MYTANTTPIKVALDFLSIRSDLLNDHVNRMRKTRLHFCQDKVFWGINQPNVLWVLFPEVLKTGNVLENISWPVLLQFGRGRLSTGVGLYIYGNVGQITYSC